MDDEVRQRVADLELQVAVQARQIMELQGDVLSVTHAAENTRGIQVLLGAGLEALGRAVLLAQGGEDLQAEINGTLADIVGRLQKALEKAWGDGV